MSIGYERINWENEPSTKTPLDADNLNKMDKAIKDLDSVMDAQTQRLNALIDDNKSTATNTYSSSKIEDKFNEFNSNLDWKESVETYADIFTTYPNPQDGWTVNVKDTDYTYRYDDTKEEWVVVSANAIPLASETVDGKMSATQVQLLNKLSRQGAISFPTSSTSADVSAKVLTINDDKWELQANKSIIYYRANAINTAENPTFNINDTGDISIAYNGQPLTTEDLDMAGSDELYIVYVYDGTYWNVVGGVGGKLPDDLVYWNKDGEITEVESSARQLYENDVQNTLDSIFENQPLSANMGRELNEKIETLIASDNDYIKFDCGILIQWGTLNNIKGDTKEQYDLIISFPIPFIDANYVPTVNFRDSLRGYSEGIPNIINPVVIEDDTSKMKFLVTINRPFDNGNTIYWNAIGRWK